MAQFFNEFKRISEQRVSPGELDRVKGFIVAAFAISLQQLKSAITTTCISMDEG